MRILIAGMVHRAEVRGGNTFIHGLARTLRDRGNDVSLLQAVRPEHRVAIDGVRMLYGDRTSKKLYPLRHAARSIRDYDVIHSHGPGGAGFALRSRVQHVPMVAQFHVPHIRREALWRANWRWRFIGVTAMNAPTLLTPTRWLAGGLAERFGLDVERFHVVPYGIRNEWFEAERPVQRDELPVRVVLVNMKGVDTALRAFAKAAPGGKATLDLYGVHRDTEAYKSLAGELGISSQVRFHGFVPNEELPERLSHVSVLLHPNHHGNMDQVLCETQSLGLPAVTSDINGNPECVDEGSTALLCPVGDVDAFANALGQMLESADLRDRFGRAARERAERVFRWSSVVERLEQEIYLPLSRGEFPQGNAGR